MKAVWLSSTYYMDPKLAGCNASVERMFTRLIAYAGNAETRGYLPENVHKIVGIPTGFRAISELISREILEPVEGGGYYLKAWSNWNESGDKLLERRENDRERQRKARARAAAESRDKSRDVTAPEESRGENSDTCVPSAAHVSTGREGENRPAEADLDQPGPKVDIGGWKLVNPRCAGLPRSTMRVLANEAGAMLKQGIAAEDIADGLERWLSKDLGPTQLPHMVTDIIRARIRPDTPAAGSTPRLAASDRKAREQAAVFDELRRRNQVATQSPLIQIVDAQPLELPPRDWTATA